MRTMRLIRRSLLVIWTAMLLGLLGSILVSHAIGMSGRQSFIIHGGSMEPTIPLGSLVAVGNVALDEIAPGDVLTMHQGDRPVVTHRVIRLQATADGTLALVTKGDANTHTDGAAVPASAVMGRVDFWVPFMGYIMAVLSAPGGMVSVLSGMASLLLAIKLLEDDEAETAAAGERTAPLPKAPAPPHQLPHLPMLSATAHEPAGAPTGLPGLT